jgi:hypothetical protein
MQTPIPRASIRHQNAYDALGEAVEGFHAAFESRTVLAQRMTYAGGTRAD